MNFAFGSPLLLATAALSAAVVAVYIFHRRPREQEVSSLLLWQGLIRPGGAGRQREQFRAPWLLALEILAIILLALAAATPLLTASVSGRSLIVILDNSYSMTAGTDGETPRDKAEAELQQLLQSYDRQRTAFVLASSTPGLVSANSTETQDPQGSPSAWNCNSPAADLLGAIRLALEIDAGSSDIVVLTDHEPDAAIEYGPRVRWLAFGQPLPNIAITGAARSPTGAVTLELTNASNQATTRTLIVERSDAEASSREVTIQPGATSRLRMPADADADLTIRLSPTDALAVDDSIQLVPEDFRPVRVAIRTASDTLRAAAERWIEAEPTAQLSAASSPELLITDDTKPAPPGAWALRIQRPESDSARPYSGPFIINREHEIAEGLDLSGLIWAADLESVPTEPAATGILSADPVVILSTSTIVEQQRYADGRRELILRIDPDRSNLTSQLAWPILLSNAARLRAEFRPGPVQRNTGVGRPLRISSLPGSDLPITVLEPDGSERLIRSERATYTPPEPGRYTIRIGEQTYPVSANLLSPQESDLRRATTASTESESSGLESDVLTTRDLTWLAATIALLLIAAHGLLVWRTYQQGGSV